MIQYDKRGDFMSCKIKILTEYDKECTLYQRFSQDIELLLSRIIQEEGIICNAITSRLKERDSLTQKIDIKNGKYGSLSDITDIAGVRIITYYADDVDRIVDLVEREFLVDKDNTIDKRKALEPDRFGYCSVHYVVGLNKDRLRLKEYRAYEGMKCEIQIRTILQHAWAEIEHDLGYKSEIAVPQDVRRNFSRLAGLLEIADKEFLEIREKLTAYKEEVKEKIKDTDFIDTDLDAVLMDTLTSSNENLMEINHEIGKAFETLVSEQSDDLMYCESIIKELRWFEINSLKQFLQFVDKNKKNAIEIARVIGASSAGEHKDEQLHKTISVFYLCYAELLDRCEDASLIIKFLSHFQIGEDADDREEFSQELLSIREELYV